MKQQQGNVSLAFGTDGIRGRADQFPFTDHALKAFGCALAAWACKKYNTQAPIFLIGMDTRISGPRIKQALIQGLAAGGAYVVDGGVLPTPAVYKLLTLQGVYPKMFNTGIVISASHNPFHDNGIKIFDAGTCKISPVDEAAIIHHTQSFLVQQQDTSTNSLVIEEWAQAQIVYGNHVTALFKKSFLRGFSVVLDCAHGALSDIATRVFTDLGAQVHALAVTPNGENINDKCGALHPESLIAAVKEQRADFGFAFDGDGDRIVAVNRYGVIKDGDDILTLLLRLPAYQRLDTVVGTIMSNQGLVALLASQGKSLLRANVGDKYVVAAMEQKNLLLGGEPSGHIIMSDYMRTSDALFVALKVLEQAILHDNWELATFQKFPQHMINVPIKHKKDLTQKPFANIIAGHEKLLNGGRVIVRYSGTEPILRVMTEAATKDHAYDIAQTLATKLQEALHEST